MEIKYLYPENLSQPVQFANAGSCHNAGMANGSEQTMRSHNQTKPDLPFISPSGGHTVTATAWPPINAATNPRRVMAKIGSGGIQILLENRLSGKPNNKLGVRENKSGKLHRTNPNSPEEKLKSIET